MTTEPILITGVWKRVGLHLALNFIARGVPVIGTYRSDQPGLQHLRAAGAELHRCDEAGVRAILIEEPPADPKWAGLRDRLKRASA